MMSTTKSVGASFFAVDCGHAQPVLGRRLELPIPRLSRHAADDHQERHPHGSRSGLCQHALRLIADELPSHLAVVFDAAGRSKRAELYPAYKANRSETPPELVPQFDLSRRMVRALGIPCLDATDVEADDIIASLAQAGRREGLPVVVVSSDKDLMQLVADGSVELLDTMKEEGRGKRFREKDVAEKFGVPPTQLAMCCR